MAKIRNFVAKYSEKFNKPVTHEDKRTYKRANRARETRYAKQEWEEHHEDEVINNDEET